MNTQKTILAILIIVILGGIGYWTVKNKDGMSEPIAINSYDECVKAGYPVMESYPEQCRTPDGHTFVHQVPPVVVDPAPTPNPNQKEFGKAVTLKLNEKATFSNGFVVILTAIDDSRCKPDVQCIWAGELGATLELSGGNLSTPGEIHLGAISKKSATVEKYTLTLKDATTTSATIVVDYKNPAVSTGGCFIGGCSAQICSDQKDIASTCEYTAAYACYQGAECKRQTTGQCGWTQTTALTACLNNAR